MRLLKKIFNFMFSRLFLVALMIVLQIAFIMTSVVYFGRTYLWLSMVFNVLSTIVAVAVVSNNENPYYKITWIFAVLFVPVVGWVFYLLFGNKRMPKKLERRIEQSLEDTRKHMQDNHLDEDLRTKNKRLSMQGKYIYDLAGYPVLQNTAAEFYPVGELMYERMIQELKKAEKFILLEYFIVKPGQMWDTMLTVLKEKARQGVEVWMMYDDLGSISTLPRIYDKIMREAGIKLQVFNPFRPRVSVILNHRDHRKITVIDGRVGFCGGINIADEYINAYERFGHWKDTGVMLQGDGVWPLTFMFLQQWQFSSDEHIDFERYHTPVQAVKNAGEFGYVQPFGDTPLDQHNVTEMTYMSAISRAKDYVYITTPYLIIDNEMEVALCTAAQSGLDVRIITPHIYDKWYVHILTRSYYKRLIEAGVKIYEYTPGFMHGKMVVFDDKACMVGTCNMDFRSFYLHFECSVVFYYSKIVAQVKQDILDCQKISHQITLEEAGTASFPIRIIRAIFKLFAPLM